ncbi:MAG TPA: chaperone modulator CbpM [Solirubrobacteraceae bacterium]|jgi:hypothetical protein
MASATRARKSRAVIRSTPALIVLDVLARQAGLHPDVARALVALGLVEPRGGTPAAPLFAPGDAQLLARAARLRRDLGLNYFGAVLACELLARIEELEQRLRQVGESAPTPDEVIAWTRTV